MLIFGCLITKIHSQKFTHRCETFNSLIRARNIYANRLAPSKDIALGFAVIEHLRFLCSGGSFDGTSRYVNVLDSDFVCL